ncbi:MAG: hypothetical protein NT105_09635 [Verrucomicrobia bacterium]|nr:hypothetical protein [Verrucomicrobiota bacterium]
MSMTEDEARYEEALEKLYQEHSILAIDEFITERLHSFYLQHPSVAQPAINSLNKARGFATTDPTSSLVFAAIATEVALRSVLLKPIVFGLINCEAAAGLITDVVFAHSSSDKFRKLMLKSLTDHGGVDLLENKRDGQGKSLWVEIGEIQVNRNKILHTAETATSEQALQAVGVATALLEKVFPSVVNKLGLHLHDGVRVCSDYHCKSKNGHVV